MFRTLQLVFLLISISLPVAACTATPPQPITSPTFTIASASVTPQPTATLAPSSMPTPVPTVLSLGYYTGSEKSFAALQAFSAYLDIVSLDVYGVQMDGSITGSDDLDAAVYAHSQGINTCACISNYNSDPQVNDFDPALAQAAIETYPDRVISQLVDLAKNNSYTGINIDFESIAFSSDIETSRTEFSAFIHALAGQLHASNLKLIISVPAKTEDSPDDDWSYPFDLAAIGEDADYLQVMTYDQHGPWGEPGPVSGVDWVEDVVVYTTSLVPADKLLIGLPAYGYDWDLSSPLEEESDTYEASSFSWVDVPTLAALPGAVTSWDETAQSPSVSYFDEDGYEHIAWYENMESLRAKVSLIPEYHLAGLSMWALGDEDIDFWLAASSVEGSNP